MAENLPTQRLKMPASHFPASFVAKAQTCDSILANDKWGRGTSGEDFLPNKKYFMSRNISFLQLDIVVFALNAWDRDSHFATLRGWA